MNLHEIEETQHECGSEQQNAFAISCMTRRPDGSSEIVRHVNKGRHVVMSEVPAYCPATDALMGTQRFLDRHFKTLEQATVYLKRVTARQQDGEECYSILSPK